MCRIAGWGPLVLFAGFTRQPRSTGRRFAKLPALMPLGRLHRPERAPLGSLPGRTVGARSPVSQVEPFCQVGCLECHLLATSVATLQFLICIVCSLCSVLQPRSLHLLCSQGFGLLKLHLFGGNNPAGAVSKWTGHPTPGPPGRTRISSDRSQCSSVWTQ